MNAGRFNAAALYDALDMERRRRGITWSQAASEIGVSPSTLTRTKSGGRMEVDGMLAMVRWLGRTAESFTFAKTNNGQNVKSNSLRVESHVSSQQ